MLMCVCVLAKVWADIWCCAVCAPPKKLQFALLAHPCPVQFWGVDLPNTHLLCKVRTPTESHLWCDSGWLGQEAEICTQPLVLPAVLCWAVTFKAPPVQSCSVCSLCRDRDLVSTVLCMGLNELMTSRRNLMALAHPSVGWPSLFGAVWELQNASCYERGTFWMKSRSIADAHGGAVFHFLQSKRTPGLAHHGNYSSCSAGFSWAICPIYPVAMGNHNCS